MTDFNNIFGSSSPTMATQQMLSSGSSYTVLQNATTVLPQNLVPQTSNTSDPIQQILEQTNEIAKNVKVLINENRELKERALALEEENIRVHTRLLSEITSQRRLFQESKTLTILPKKPFETMSEMDQFEEKIRSSSDLYNQLETEIFKCNSASEPSKFIRQMWRTFMVDSLAAKFSWRGAQNKVSIMAMTTTSAFRSAFIRKFSSGKKIFITVSSKWFQTANDRIKYINKKK